MRKGIKSERERRRFKGGGGEKELKKERETGRKKYMNVKTNKQIKNVKEKRQK